MNEASETPATAGEVVTYSFRPSLIGAPQEFAVEPGALRWHVGSRAGRIPYRSIRRIRLSYRPATMQTHRFLMEIWAEGAPKLTIASTSWRTLVDQERQDSAYTTFVRALHRRLAEAGGKPALRAGSPPLVYWPGVVVFLGMAVALPAIVIKNARGDALVATLLVGAIVGAFLWQLGAFFWRNRPARYSAETIPGALLPA
ncbi:MAG: hypothetical protein IRZ09_13305 [Variibacter sp.]|nr:hypothetical protein [Variibacter sp.]